MRKNKSNKRVENGIYAVLWILFLGASWYGMDFSPSFTMMLLVANLLLCSLGELLYQTVLADGKTGLLRERPARWAGYAEETLYVAGVRCSVPAVLIYATGDDMLMQCMLGAFAVGSVMAFLVLRGKKGVPGHQTERWLSFLAAFFALFCGTRSTAMLPYGLGLLVMELGRLTKRRHIRRGLWLAGIALAALTALAPTWNWD